jgi:hypothetical protein
MSRTITISDELYARWEAKARARGNNIERLLEERERRESQDKISGTVHVIVLSPEKSVGTPDMVDRLLEHPIELENFAPLTREEIYERR